MPQRQSGCDVAFVTHPSSPSSAEVANGLELYFAYPLCLQKQSWRWSLPFPLILQFTKLLIVNLSPTSCYFFFLQTKYFLRHTILRIPAVYIFPYVISHSDPTYSRTYNKTKSDALIKLSAMFSLQFFSIVAEILKKFFFSLTNTYKSRWRNRAKSY